MAFTEMTDDVAIIAALADLPNATSGLTAAQLKAKFDVAAGLLKTYLNDTLLTELAAVTDGSSGADNIGATAITSLDGATVQAVIESLRNKLKATTDGSSGADFIGATAVSGITGDTVQAILEALKTYIDAQDTGIEGDYVSKTELTDTRLLSATGNFTGSWFGLTNPAASEPGIQNQVDANTERLVDISSNVKSYGAVGDYDPITGLGTDDTVAFQNAIAASSNIFIPAGNYKISDTLDLQIRTVISGVYKQTKLYFTKDNATLFVGNIRLFPTTSFFYGMLENFDIIGLGKTFDQKGLDLNGYQSHVNGVGISKFNRGVELRGVQFSFDDCYIHSNATGISIQDAIDGNGNADYNTMLHFKHCNFLLNDLGMANTGEGQALTGGEKNVIDLALEKCIFEQNTKGFALIPFTGSIRECWFENNTTRSTTRKFSWIIANNRYSTNGGDNTIDYLTTAGTSEFYGTVELVPSFGVAHARTFDFQNYDTTGLDISTRKLIEQKRTSITSAVGVVDATDATTRELTELNPMTLNNGTTQVLMNKITQLSILPDGTIYARATDPKYTGYSVSKIATGRYKVVLHTTHFRGMPQIFVASPTAVNSDTLQDTFYYTTHMGNASDLSAYATQGYFTAIYIDTYKRPSGGGADALADAWIFMSLYHA